PCPAGAATPVPVCKGRIGGWGRAFTWAGWPASRYSAWLAPVAASATTKAVAAAIPKLFGWILDLMVGRIMAGSSTCWKYPPLPKADVPEPQRRVHTYKCGRPVGGGI